MLGYSKKVSEQRRDTKCYLRDMYKRLSVDAEIYFGINQ